MTKTYRTTLALTVAVISAFVLAGCGASDGTDSADGPTGDVTAGRDVSEPGPQLDCGEDPGDPSGSDPSRLVGATDADNQPGRYWWVGDNLCVAEGTTIAFVGDSTIPAYVHPLGGSLDLRFATVVDRSATISFAGIDTGDIDIALPSTFNWKLHHEGFEADAAYDGCWGGNCVGGVQLSFTGDGTDQIADTGNPNTVTFSFTDGSAGTITIYNDEVARTEQQGRDTVVTLTADVLFEFGKSDLVPGARQEIEALAAEISQGATVSVDGYTDSISGDDINQPLSEARAAAVADVLTQTRPDLRLTVAGHSSADPVAPNQIDGQDNPAGRALNRRVEITYLSG
ncbi:MAG: OmpA family protein [Micrococcales bacterium]|nr:OmpA family protein [Micrococcales bacterium]